MNLTRKFLGGSVAELLLGLAGTANAVTVYDFTATAVCISYALQP